MTEPLSLNQWVPPPEGVTHLPPGKTCPSTPVQAKQKTLRL